MMKSITKALIFVFCVSVLTGACSKDESETPQTSDSLLKGKVKVITEYKYEGTENNGVIQKTRLRYTDVLKYNEDGKITNEGNSTYMYNEAGKLVEYRSDERRAVKYLYDEKGNPIETDHYSGGVIDQRNIHKTDDLGRIIETKIYYGTILSHTIYINYDADGNLSEKLSVYLNDGYIGGKVTYKISYKYDDYRNLTRETSYLPDETIESITDYKYDLNRNLTQINHMETNEHNPGYRHTFKYLNFDKTGNWIEMVDYYGVGDNIDKLESITEREIEYYQ